MAFKKTGGSTVAMDSPEAMFRDFRSRKIPGPLGHQADIMRSYASEAVEKADVAFQLPTGSGKTLVGLVVAEWRRRRDQLPVVYLCPTNQLVNQVVEQATAKYAIGATAFTGPKSDYSAKAKAEYRNAETIAVTTYSALFNVSPFFDTPGLIVLDDTHAAENYIAKHWSVTIRQYVESEAALFGSLAQALATHLPTVEAQRMNDAAAPPDFAWVDKLSTPLLQELRDDVLRIVDAHAEGSSDLKYRWSVIRPHLHACHLYVSASSILIRPLIPPTRTHRPFSDARQRMYMSATLGAGGELERLTGIAPIHRLPVPAGWDKQGIGRRFFMLPERSLESTEVNKLVLKAMTLTPRTLVLTTRDADADVLAESVSQELSYEVFRAEELEQSKQRFARTDKAVAIVANRYDGIDMADDECRLLVVGGLPRAMNLQERFLITRIGSSALFTDRVLTRVIQAVGRCTRGATDYAAVIVLGDDLNSFLLRPNNRVLLHPELQGELGFGLEQSKDVTRKDFVDNLKAFFDQGDEWRGADESIVSIREQSTQKEMPGVDDLQAAVGHEISYMYSMWNADYLAALESARAILGLLNATELRPYREFWNYAAGSCAWLAHSELHVSGLDQTARQYFGAACRSNTSIRWLAKLQHLGSGAIDTSYDDRLAAVVERLEHVLVRLGTANDNRFEKFIKELLEGISASEASEFEEGHRQLGELLGYQADNSEGEGDPDPRWMASEDWCLVFEDHTPDNGAGSLGSTKVRQVASHPNWVRANDDRLSRGATVVAVLISPRTSIRRGAVAHAQTAGYWNLGEFREFARAAVAKVRDLRRTFSSPGDIAWRAEAMSVYRDAGMDPASLEALAKEHRLADLPVSG